MLSAAVSACEQSRNSIVAVPTDTLHYTLQSHYRLPHFRRRLCRNREHQNYSLM